MAKFAINGLGRIGRAALRVVLDTPQLELVAVNDIAPIDNLAYLLRYDTVYGRYGQAIETEDDYLIIGGKRYPAYHEKDPAHLPWAKLGVDIVLECTGVFTKREDLSKHIRAGAGYVILSAPASGGDVDTVIHGVNRLEGGFPRILSCASCTTNSITPVMEVMGRRIGITKAIMTTVHAYTASQSIVDAPNKKYRRGRAAAASIIPASTGAAVATTKALPQFKDLFDGVALRVPVSVGSISDITLLTARKTSVEEVNRIFREEAASERYAGVLGVTSDPIVSADIVQDSRAAIVDLDLTRVVDGDLVKVMSWYDNEWGYTHQLVRQATEIAEVLQEADRLPVPPA
jgi:glyceraldehyde 3-phosphate dehydrogenase